MVAEIKATSPELSYTDIPLTKPDEVEAAFVTHLKRPEDESSQLEWRYIVYGDKDNPQVVIYCDKATRDRDGMDTSRLHHKDILEKVTSEFVTIHDAGYFDITLSTQGKIEILLRGAPSTLNIPEVYDYKESGLESIERWWGQTEHNGNYTWGINPNVPRRRDFVPTD